MICVVIKGPSVADILHQMEVSRPYADLYEFYFDSFCKEIDLSTLKELKEKAQKPLIFTLRDKQGREEKWFKEVMKVGPDFVDFDISDNASLRDDIMAQYPNIQLILSYHDFREIPLKLDDLFEKMQTIKASFYKLALTPHSTTEVLSFLLWTKEKKRKDLITLSMGEYGKISRIMAPCVGSAWSYACVKEGLESAPGQLSGKELCEIYHYKKLNEKTSFYGLIGDPVSGSPSDRTHNAYFETKGINALYVKMRLTKEELPLFFKQVKALGFKGLSVTMPLKEVILNDVDEIDGFDEIDKKALEIGAINTLTFLGNKIYGDNTDAKACLDAIEKKGKVFNKKMAILGAGGAAKAILYEAHKRGAILSIFNRDVKKAERVIFCYGGKAFSLSDTFSLEEEGYDIIINATSLPLPVDPSVFRKGQMVMDIVISPIETLFLKEAKERGCILIYGYEMFCLQAEGQFIRWGLQQTEENSFFETKMALSFFKSCSTDRKET